MTRAGGRLRTGCLLSCGFYNLPANGIVEPNRAADNNSKQRKTKENKGE